ncbi:hypothetical protein [Nonlabens sp. YIK11]|uniref:hypothetical protein n=1 Tax=Nonlabens sp. YIK11 TaxID=1453349 RepID=UPI0012E166F3|nr:hypothetical protein [Nonlabens sp. YIK11]
MKKYSYDWLLGSWERTNDRSGKRTFEVWQKWNSNFYHGKSYTLSQNDTIYKEIKRLFYYDGKWNIEVNDKNGLTLFKAQKNIPNSFSVYNPDHDFPKEIHYWIQNDTLRASVGNDGEKNEFSFVKL